MKILSLNLHCGANFKALTEFLERYSPSVDIFCFQEVPHKVLALRPVLKGGHTELFTELQALLPEFEGFHASPDKENDIGGLAIFVRKGIAIHEAKNEVILSELPFITDRTDDRFFTMGRNLQCLEFEASGKTYTVFNFHGMYIEKGKGDTMERLEQSKAVKKIIDQAKGGKILCTDLNVSPDTESLTILAKGNIDLIAKYGIATTRSASKGRKEVVDYIIISPEVKVVEFKVPEEEVSDHLPLVVEVEL